MQDVTNSRRWSILGQVLLFLVLCAIILAVTSGLMFRFPPRWSGLAVGVVTSVCTFVLTIPFLRWNRLKLADAGAAPAGRSVLRLVAGLLCGLALVALQLCLLRAAGHVSFLRSPDVGLPTVGVALLTYLALACREELAFHGYALRRLERPFGLWIAQFTIAVVFALEHVLGGVSWVHAFSGAAVGSLLFGMAALATRGLAIPIGMHAGWNFGQWALGGKDSPGIWKRVAEPGSAGRLELYTSLSYMIVFLCATAAFWVLYKEPKHCDENEATQVEAAE